MCAGDQVPKIESQPAQELVERWRAGDQVAADELHRRFAQRLCKLVERELDSKLRARVDASDVVQSAFRSFFRRTRDGQYSVDHSGALWRLLVRITVRKVRKHAEYHRAAKRDCAKEVSADEEYLEMVTVAAGPSPEEAAIFTELLEKVQCGLNEAEQAIFCLRLGGYPIAEIAAKVGCTRWAVRRTLARMEKRLLGLVEREESGEC